jgi:hypothetical protein
LIYQSAVANQGLTISFSEFFALPLFMQDTILDNQKELSSSKSTKMNNMTKQLNEQ